MTSVTESHRALMTAAMEAMSRGDTRPFGEAYYLKWLENDRRPGDFEVARPASRPVRAASS